MFSLNKKPAPLPMFWYAFIVKSVVAITKSIIAVGVTPTCIIIVVVIISSIIISVVWLSVAITISIGTSVGVGVVAGHGDGWC